MLQVIIRQDFSISQGITQEFSSKIAHLPSTMVMRHLVPKTSQLSSQHRRAAAMAYDYDLFVIGAGSGGLAAAKRAASYGAKVAIAENDLVGGTCVIRGCVPKKMMVYASHFSELFENAAGYGWSVGEPELNWSKLIHNVDHEVNRLSRLHISLLEKNGVELIQGRAHFVDAHTLEVTGMGAENESKKFTADKILIATGSRAVLPDTPGIEHALTSRDMFKLETKPEHIAIIGGGYIGVEFAGIMNGLGVKVSQIIRRDRILRGFDDDLRNHVQENMTRIGINILTNTNVVSLEKTDDGVVLNLEGDTSEPLKVDAAVLFAIGRAPNVEGLGLETVDVELDRGAIAVDEYNQTNQPHIFAVGDVINRVQLTPVAVDEGRAFADTQFGNAPRTVNYENIPTAVFCQPEIGTVGLTEVEAKAKFGEENLKIYRAKFRPLFHSLTGSEERVLMKLIVHTETDRVLGAHMVGKDAAEIIQSVAIAINMGATKKDFDATMALHPSTAEEFVTMR
jgi:glutathione reductase (NADPH)